MNPITSTHSLKGIYLPSCRKFVVSWTVPVTAEAKPRARLCCGATAAAKPTEEPADKRPSTATAETLAAYIPMRSARSTVFRMMRAEAASTIVPSMATAPSPWASASA